MNTIDTAACFAELGHETRLAIFRYLVKAGRQPIAVGQIQEELQIPNSTLSHHISRLQHVGLITQVRDGRKLLCSAEYEKLQSLIDFLIDECCEGETCEVEQTSKTCC